MSPFPQAVIRLQGVSKVFPDVPPGTPPALSSLTADVPPVWSWGLGPDAAGKTTLRACWLGRSCRPPAPWKCSGACPAPRRRTKPSTMSGICRSVSVCMKIRPSSTILTSMPNCAGLKDRRVRPCSKAADVHGVEAVYGSAGGKAFRRHEAETRPCLRAADHAPPAAAR